MKKEELFLVLVLVLLSSVSVVSAGTDEIHNDWHKYRDTFQIGDDVYRLRLLESDLDQLRVDFNNVTVLVPIDSCQDYNEYDFCYDEYSYDVDEVDISDLGVVMPGVSFRVLKSYSESLSSYLNLNHYYEYTSDIGVKNTVYVKFENTGTAWANPIKYEVTLPDTVELVSKRSFTQIGNKLEMITSLPPDGVVEYDFSVKSNSTGTHTFNYVISSTDEVNGEQNSTGSFEMDSPEIYGYEYTNWLYPESVGLYDDSEIGITLTNTLDKDSITIKKLVLNAPPSLSLVPSVGTLYFAKFGQYKGAIDTIDPGKTKDFKLKIRPFYTGTYNLTGEIEFEVLNKTYSDNFSKILSVTEGGIQSNLWLSKYDVISGSELFLYFTLENYNDDLIYTDFDIAIDGGFFTEHTNLSALNNNQKVQLIVKELTVPMLEADKEYNVTAKIEYKNPAGQFRTLTNQVTLYVSGTGSVLTLRQEANKENVNRGEEIIVETYVGNLKDDYFGGISVYDELPKNIEVQVGQASNQIGLQGKEEKRAYLYKIRVPEDYADNKIEIKSTVKLPDYDYEINSTKTIYVNDAQPQEQPQEEQNLDVNIEDTGPEVKESLWTKITKGIGDFFTRLFSRNN